MSLMPATCEFYKLRNEQTGISTLFPTSH